MKIERGNIVRLNSGGPDMIVRFLNGEACICEWQGKASLPEAAYFPIASLTLVKRNERLP